MYPYIMLLIFTPSSHAPVRDKQMRSPRHSNRRTPNLTEVGEADLQMMEGIRLYGGVNREYNPT